MTGPERAGEQLRVPRRVDAVLHETLALLELVRRESEVMAQLRRAVAELETIRAARATLADQTNTEVSEAVGRLDVPPAGADLDGWGR